MREIKFRAFDTYNMKMINLGDLELIHLSSDLDLDFANYEVMQYTGLKDRNGKEIYEGDIIGEWVEVDGKMEQSALQVYWHDIKCFWALDLSYKQDKSEAFLLSTELSNYKFEIIGNIYENPELLK